MNLHIFSNLKFGKNLAVKLQPFALPGRILSVLLILSGAGMFPALAETQIPTTAKYVMVTEFETGRVLMAKEKDAPMKPASMAKIMTSYVVFSRIKDGSLALEDLDFGIGKGLENGWLSLFPEARYTL